ncbi:MAG: hypothetical protein KC468_37325 [Myxococcales bacterium]|nr:hypothetical protein [Myxococcales bacterium]
MSNPLALALVLISASPEGPAPHVAEDGGRSDRVHVQLDTDASWGVGGQMFLGAQLRAAALLEHWTTRLALGTWDFGVNFAYQNEPVFLAPWINRDQVTGAGHRVQLLATVGHSAHMGRRRRVALGLHLFGGWSYWRSAYSVRYPSESVAGEAVVARHHPIVGGEVRLAYRLHRRVGLNLAIGAPFPTNTSYAITFGHLCLGLSLYLR